MPRRIYGCQRCDSEGFPRPGDELHKVRIQKQTYKDGKWRPAGEHSAYWLCKRCRADVEKGLLRRR